MPDCANSVSYTHLDVYKRQVYIPVNVPMYAGCYYGYDLTEPAGVQVSAPTGWQRDSAVVRFSGGTDTGTSLPDWSAAPGDYGSGIHHLSLIHI